MRHEPAHNLLMDVVLEPLWNTFDSTKAYSGTPLMRPPLGYKIVVVKMRWSHSRVIFKKIKNKISLISTFEFREYGRNNEVII